MCFPVVAAIVAVRSTDSQVERFRIGQRVVVGDGMVVVPVEVAELVRRQQ